MSSTADQKQTSARSRTKANSSAYLRTKVMTASPAELRLMLFDGAIRFAEMAKDGLQGNNAEQVYEGVTRCQAILMELISTLRPEHDPDLCEKLSALYTFLYTQLIDVSFERDEKKLDEVLELLRYERETWSMVMGKLVDDNREAIGMTTLPETAAHAKAAGANDNTSKLVGGRLSIQG